MRYPTFRGPGCSNFGCDMSSFVSWMIWLSSHEWHLGYLILIMGCMVQMAIISLNVLSHLKWTCLRASCSWRQFQTRSFKHSVLQFWLTLHPCFSNMLVENTIAFGRRSLIGSTRWGLSQDTTCSFCYCSHSQTVYFPTLFFLFLSSL
jgi:hypothetical protein